MAFIIASPRSGSTMLERMLEAHSMVLGGPEPHLLTPLAHLGIWDNVDKAPYDHILAAEAQKLFISKLPHGEQDYWDACRAYCDTLYGRYLEGSGKTVCLDKTPAYALIVPFMRKVFPDARYVVLTRHPVAIFLSYSNSFFDGDYERAHAYNPILKRYVPALAALLRQSDVPHVHVRYEDLVTDPEAEMRRIYDHLELPFEADTIEYGGAKKDEPREGLGDPLGVDRHAKPTTTSVAKWARELAADEAARRFMEARIAELAPEDLDTVGYPLDTLWEPLEALGGQHVTLPKTRLNRYRLQRKLIVGGRNFVQGNSIARKGLSKLRLVCDVLLRQ